MGHPLQTAGREHERAASAYAESDPEIVSDIMEVQAVDFILKKHEVIAGMKIIPKSADLQLGTVRDKSILKDGTGQTNQSNCLGFGLVRTFRCLPACDGIHPGWAEPVPSEFAA